MNLEAHFCKSTFNFKRPAGTSRGVLTEKECWFIIIREKTNPKVFGIGECGMFRGLSIDDRPDYESTLRSVCSKIKDHRSILDSVELDQFPSIRFGLEQALIDLSTGGNRILFPSKWTEGQDSIHINGLIWMGDSEYLKSQISSRLESGFSCLKMKIGALNFDEELKILTEIRKNFKANDVEIRVDANGAFSFEEAMTNLEKLSDLEIHSIEQPIKAGQYDKMAELCSRSSLPIALDEELIGVFGDKRIKLLEHIQPAYIILKPTLIGGFAYSQEWIRCAEKVNCGWWVTSALESNIGLSAIAQWTYTLGNPLPQGLGTGSLYTNNVPSPVRIENGSLLYDPENPWDLGSVIASSLNQLA